MPCRVVLCAYITGLIVLATWNIQVAAWPPATAIVEGRVAAVEAYWDGAYIAQNVTLEVSRVVEGDLREELLIFQSSGGKLNNHIAWAFGRPQFVVGEDVRVAIEYEGKFARWTVLKNPFVATKTVLGRSSNPREASIEAEKTGGQGYAFSGLYWPGAASVAWYINSAGTLDIPGTAEFNAVILGFEPWRFDGGSYAGWSYGGTKTNSPSNRNDGTNVVGWVDPGHSDWVGYTECRVRDFLIQECDTELNDRFQWSITGEVDKVDVQNIVTHEAGHFTWLLDLPDVLDESQTMYAYPDSPGNPETKRRTLEWGDVAGLRYVYFYSRSPWNVGWSTQGADVDLGLYDAGSSTDMLVTWVDNPSGQNYFNWMIGYAISTTDGSISSWSAPRPSPWGIGHETQGLGVARGNVNGGSNDMVFLWIDNPTGTNFMYYRVGYNIASDGSLSSWSSLKGVPGPFASDTPGAGVTFANLDGDALPELIVFWPETIGATTSVRYKVLYDINAAGDFSSASGIQTLSWTISSVTFGMGARLADVDFNGIPDIVVSYASNGISRFRIGWDINSLGLFAGWSREFTVGRNEQPAGGGNGVGVADIWYQSANAREVVVFSIDDALFDDPMLYQWV